MARDGGWMARVVAGVLPVAGLLTVAPLAIVQRKDKSDDAALRIVRRALMISATR